MSVDLGSNDITNQGAALLFDAIKYHPTLTALNIANHDRINRNRLNI